MFFDFVSMMGNYEERKVALYQDGDFVVDTCAVNDGAYLYETAVKHPAYNGGKWVIVEAYDSQEEALAGHGRWVVTMTGAELPDKLVDCDNSDICQLEAAICGDAWETEFMKEVEGEYGRECDEAGVSS